MRIFIICLFIVGLTGCTKSARLYPANDPAADIGTVEVTYVSYGTGRVDAELKMPDGEILKGEATVVRGGSIGFGSIIGSVYGAGGAAFGNATATSISMPGGSPGKASVFGDKGSYGECEYYNDNWSGHGYGACKVSHKGQKDALFRLQY